MSSYRESRRCGCSSAATLHCVWSRKRLDRKTLDVDHCLPWSAWPCGDLWNLLPTHRMVNQHAKRDRLPAETLLQTAREPIVEWWEAAYPKGEILPRRFTEEARASLPGSPVKRPCRRTRMLSSPPSACNAFDCVMTSRCLSGVASLPTIKPVPERRHAAGIVFYLGHDIAATGRPLLTVDAGGELLGHGWRFKTASTVSGRSEPFGGHNLNGREGWNSDILADANLKVRWPIATTVLR